ncbi:MAG: DegV family protein [Chloroflexi bacterium]|nr:DegV family protein [Chloroflexota bacterium]
MTVKIVTDSTSDMPPELAAELGVTVIPLTVFFGEEAFKDGIDITRDEFMTRLTTGGVFPHTSQPSPGDFVEVYKKLTEAGDDVVSIHISDKLSGTLNSARGAVQELPNARIELVDTQLTSLALTLVVRAAAVAASGGATAEEVVRIADEASSKIDLFFLLDTLEYLSKGGRIGKAQALIGGLLSIKPVLKLVDGELHPHEKVRTRAKALARMKEIAAEGAPYEEIALIHELPAEDVREFEDVLRPLSKAPLLTGRIGSVIGTHTGPNVIGFALRRA